MSTKLKHFCFDVSRRLLQWLLKGKLLLKREDFHLFGAIIICSIGQMEFTVLRQFSAPPPIYTVISDCLNKVGYSFISVYQIKGAEMLLEPANTQGHGIRLNRIVEFVCRLKMQTTLATSSTSASKEPQWMEYKLTEDHELRFEVNQGNAIVMLSEGMAEVFGSELMLNKQYTFPANSRAAVFTWHGCTVKLSGSPEGVYVAKKTPMVIYVNTHQALEYMRNHAQRNGTRGPRIMVVGSTDVGKSTYCRILLNYAVRMGHFPTFIDLDVGQGQICIPGCIAALYVEKPADPVDGFDKRVPLVYCFGYNSPSANLPLYMRMLECLAKALNDRCSKNAAANLSGFVINTCGWIKDAGYKCITYAAETFEVDVVVVIDQERVYNDLLRDLPSIVKIVHQPKSGGVEERSTETRKVLRRNRIHEYFYGTSQQPYYPHSFEVSFNEVAIFKIGAPLLPDSCMPLGMKPEDTSTKVVPVAPSPQLLHHILAVSHCESPTENILNTNVAGFVCVSKVSIDKQSMTVLSPQPRPLPRSILLWTDITFMDLLH